MARCKVTKGMPFLVQLFQVCALGMNQDFCDQSVGTVSIQSWPKATVETKLRLYMMAEVVGEVYEQVPLVHRIFDVLEDKGAVLVVSELPCHGTLWDALMAADKIDHIPWLVCEVRGGPTSNPSILFTQRNFKLQSCPLIKFW